MNIELKTFFEELKRRRVFRVAGVYAGFAFIVFQIIDATFDTLGIPGWLGKYTIIALILGFPIAVGLGWAFDITDKGVVRTKNQPIEHDSWKPFVGNTSLSIVAGLAIILAVWGWMKTPQVRTEGYQAIAVLPFDNYMGDKTQDYFVDGMTESIIAELARLKGLKVISRTSAMRFRGSDKSIPQIASELGVDAIIEGSVLKAGNDVRITAQLIDGLSDEHLWANSFDKSLDQILSLQRDVAAAIAEQIKWTLNPDEEDYFQETAVVNSEAYELYLKGWHQRLLETNESLLQALKYFHAAIALDSSLYQAYAAQVVTYFLAPLEYDPDQIKWTLDQALHIAPDAAESLMALAMYDQLFALDLKGAGEAFERVLSLRPGDADVRREYGLFLMRMGKFEESRKQLEISKAYDPVSALSLRDLAQINCRLGNGQEALELIDKTLEIEPEQEFSGSIRGMALLTLNRVEEAERYYQVLSQKYGGYPRGEVVSAMRAGRSAEFVVLADSVLQQTDPADYLSQAILYGIKGDVERAMTAFKQCVAQRKTRFFSLNEDPIWDPIRHHPDYVPAMMELGFPEKQPESFSDLLERLYGPPPDSPIIAN